MHVQPVDHVETAEELTGEIGRVAEVVVERDPAEQMIAGQEQAPPRLVEDDVRGRVPGRLVHLPGTQVRLDLHARQELSVREDDLRDAELVVPARLAKRSEEHTSELQPTWNLV